MNVLQFLVERIHAHCSYHGLSYKILQVSLFGSKMSCKALQFAFAIDVPFYHVVQEALVDHANLVILVILSLPYHPAFLVVLDIPNTTIAEQLFRKCSIVPCGLLLALGDQVYLEGLEGHQPPKQMQT
jgi:hypothetical protein